MDPKLKKYLEKEFAGIQSSVSNVKAELKKDIKDLTHVVKDFGENTGGIIEKFEDYHTDLVNRTDGLSHRIDFVQDQVVEIKNKIKV